MRGAGVTRVMGRRFQKSLVWRCRPQCNKFTGCCILIFAFLGWRGLFHVGWGVREIIHPSRVMSHMVTSSKIDVPVLGQISFGCSVSTSTRHFANKIVAAYGYKTELPRGHFDQEVLVEKFNQEVQKWY